MKSILSASVLALMALTGSRALAMCSDNVVAQCGKFDVVDGFCGGKSYLTAQYNDGSPSVTLKMKKQEEGTILSGPINDHEKLVITTSGLELGKDGKGHIVYRTYIESGKAKGTVTECKNMNDAPIAAHPPIKGTFQPRTQEAPAAK